MKKKVSLFVVFCMVLGLLVSGVAAEEENGVVISTGDYTVDAGDVFWVDLSIEGGKNLFAGFDFILNTDSAVVAFDRELDDFTGEYASERKAGDVWRASPSVAANAEDPEFIHIAGGDANPIKEDGIFYSVQMIAVGEPGDSVELTFGENSTAVGIAGAIPSTYVGGTVNIFDPEAEKIEDAMAAVAALFDGDELADGVNQAKIDAAAALVAALQDGEEKTALSADLAAAQELYDVIAAAKALAAAQDATNALVDDEGNLIEGATQAQINAAKALVDALADGAEKDALLALLAGAQADLDARVDEDDDDDDDDDADEDVDEDKDEKHPSTGSAMLPFLLIGGLLAVIGAVMLLPIKKLRRQ